MDTTRTNTSVASSSKVIISGSCWGRLLLLLLLGQARVEVWVAEVDPVVEGLLDVNTPAVAGQEVG